MPVTRFDEYPVQQIESTFDHVEDSDRRWFERYWFCVHDPAGEVALAAGIGVYPNANLIDGFATAVAEGSQATVRAARALDHERTDTRVGPLAVEVVRGLATVRIAAETDELAYGLELEAAAPPLDRTQLPFLRLPDGRLQQRASMFAQAGRATGRLRIGGREHEVAGWPYAKTNSWGIRARAGAAPFLSVLEGDAWSCLVGDAEGVEWRFDPLLTLPLAGLWGGHDDAFDGLYRGDEAYEGTVETETSKAAAPGTAGPGRTAHVARITVEPSGKLPQGVRGAVGVVEVGAA